LNIFECVGEKKQLGPTMKRNIKNISSYIA
jgi:hypothetical protein